MSELIFNSVNLNPVNAVSSSEKNRAELKKVAQEFEAVFIAQLLKIMRETIEESGMEGGGFGKSIYTELFDQEIALSMARRGTLGIGDIIYKSLADKEAAQSPEMFETAQPGREVSRQAPESSGKLPVPDASVESVREISVPLLPVDAPVSSTFGVRKDPFNGKPRFHKGIDLAAPAGTPVVAALPGRVISAGYESGYGNSVLVEHDGGLRTRYGHLASVDVKAGDMVTSDDTLGKVGSTGRSTGAHLHFEVIRMGTPVDPAKMAAFMR
ncbi:MAG: peptidoglycan DD-metalloendopeptidase family protein [Acidobacteria bacterium]|nr:peptidoglycan DD-metalloendopeptidase family protein [Acidobacteriota bacterium]